MIEITEKNKGLSVTEIMDEVANEACNNLCRFNSTADDSCVCEYQKLHGYCPLDRLY